MRSSTEQAKPMEDFVTTQKVRASIAILTVTVFMGITAFLALFPLLSKTNVELSAYADFFVKIASIYTGILGVIIGYYFGRAQDSEDGKRLTRAESDAQRSPS